VLTFVNIMPNYNEELTRLLVDMVRSALDFRFAEHLYTVPCGCRANTKPFFFFFFFCFLHCSTYHPPSSKPIYCLIAADGGLLFIVGELLFLLLNPYPAYIFKCEI